MSIPTQDTTTRDDLGTLAVLEALTQGEQVTQRELSRQTGLNLKKVNYCLHRLLEKGHVKFQRALNKEDKRSFLYILTPAGLKEKSRLTYRFMKMTIGYYNRVEEKLQECLGSMSEAGVRRIALFGASEAARIVVSVVRHDGIEVVAIVDDSFDSDVFSGVPLVSEEELKTLELDGVLITVLNDLDIADLRLRELGVPESKVWHLS
jgi:DNA-binding MarR family transcriptional regulator